jgi:hypothetical protein
MLVSGLIAALLILGLFLSMLSSSPKSEQESPAATFRHTPES